MDGAKERARLPQVPEEGSYSPSTYTPFGVGESLAAAVSDAVFVATHGDAPADDLHEIPISPWRKIEGKELEALACSSSRRAGGARAACSLVALSDSAATAEVLESLVAAAKHVDETLHALRADSPGAPATHAEAVKRGFVWVQSELKELDNHRRNQSWVLIPPSEVPKGRRIHRMIWVYKQKRDGTAKARLCVQGSSLEAGIDFDQVFSAALRYSSARGLF